MKVQTLCAIAGFAVAGSAIAGPSVPVKTLNTGVAPTMSEYVEREMKWDTSYRMFKYINGEKVYGQWINADDVAAAVRQQANRGGGVRQAFDAMGQNIVDDTNGVGEAFFGLDVCGFPLTSAGGRYTAAANVWSNIWEDIQLAPEDSGVMVDAVNFGWSPDGVPNGVAGPFATAPGALRPNQFNGCHQLVWEVELWDDFDSGEDTDGDGIPDLIGEYPALDEMGNPIPGFFTPAPLTDADMNGTPDSFLGGYQLFIIGGFFPGDTSGDGVANNPDDFICPDLDFSGDPFNDFFNPIPNGGWTDFSNYSQINSPGFPYDVATGFTTAIDAGLGNAFDVDGDGNPDVPMTPADGSGSLRISTFSAADTDLDGTFDLLDGPAWAGGPVLHGTNEEFPPAHPVTPGDSGIIAWAEGEDRSGTGNLTTVADPSGEPASDGQWSAADEVFATGALPDAAGTGNCANNFDAIMASIYVVGGTPPVTFFCADANLDGVVNGTDFGAWLGAFNAGLGTADANGDNVVNGTDFGAWLGQFNLGAGGAQCDFDLGI